MIKKLKRRFITTALIAFVSALLALVIVLNLFITFSFTEVIDYNLDRLMDREINNQTPPEDPENPLFRVFNDRFFIIYYDDTTGTPISYLIPFQDMITADDAYTNALVAISQDGLRGWSDDYRYLKYEDGANSVVIFIDGEFFTYAFSSFRTFSLIALGITTVAVTAFLFLTSNRAIKPTLESYELQRQFMTDASHELKTPLSVITANTEILRETDMDNEWLISIQKQTKLLTGLINQIVKISRMDETELAKHQESINFSILAQDVIDDFQPVIIQQHLRNDIHLEDNIKTLGEKQSLMELVKILVDNAVKYCDEKGYINISLETQHKTLVFIIRNTYTDVDKVDFDKIFNRFYRMDYARKSDGSFGLGLSIASSVAKIHRGSLIASKYDDKMIQFILKLPIDQSHNV